MCELPDERTWCVIFGDKVSKVVPPEGSQVTSAWGRGHGWVGGGKEGYHRVPQPQHPAHLGLAEFNPSAAAWSLGFSSWRGLISGEQALWTEQTRVLKRNSSFYKSPLWDPAPKSYVC